MEITGKIESIKKDRKGIKIAGKWYSSNYINPITANIGDEVKITLNNKGYLESVETLKKSETNGKEEFRANVDAGNILQRATELTIAVLNNSKDVPAINEVLNEAVNQCLKQFKRIKYDLEKKEKENETKQ